MNESLSVLIFAARTAQAQYATFTQTQIDAIFTAVASAASSAAIPLAIKATEETGRGVMEDKVTKNRFAAENIYNAYKACKTIGIVEESPMTGTLRVAEPVGVIAALTPVTNPSSTVIFKTLLALKTGNAIIFAPHPSARTVSWRTAAILEAAAQTAGAPKGLVSCLENPTFGDAQDLMAHADLVLATGGPGMVEAAYSSGTPAIGVGPGNTPAIIDELTDLDRAVHSIVLSKCFDNGMVCASEQTVVVVNQVYNEAIARFARAGAYSINEEDHDRLECVLFPDGKNALNPAVVGRSAAWIAQEAGIRVPDNTKLLLVEVDSPRSRFCREKLSPILAVLRADSFYQALTFSHTLLLNEGAGHTAVLHTDQHDPDRGRIKLFAETMPAARLLINQPASHGAIGDLYNFDVPPALTLGCGSWGGNSISGQLGIQHLMNVKTVAKREVNALWFKVPNTFFGPNCLTEALKDLRPRGYGGQRAVLITDAYLHNAGICTPVVRTLEARGIAVTVFADIPPDPTTDDIERGVDVVRSVRPHMIFAVGGGSPIDAAKVIRVRYNEPSIPFNELAHRFADLRKRIHALPTLSTPLIAIPTTSGTGSEVTPFAVVTDSATRQKYPLADYELAPTLAIVDSAFVTNLPKPLIAAGGIDAVVHALEAYVSVFATEFTDGYARSALTLLHDHLVQSYNGVLQSREPVHRAATLAGMAFANAFLGVCHALAHKIGARFHIPHGMATAMLIESVIRYNAYTGPQRMTAFSQYASPDSNARYTDIARHLGLCARDDPNPVEQLIAWIRELKNELGIPATLHQWGVDEDEFNAALDQLALDAFDDQCIGANPRAPLISDLKALLVQSYYGWPAEDSSCTATTPEEDLDD